MPELNVAGKLLIYRTTFGFFGCSGCWDSPSETSHMLDHYINNENLATTSFSEPWILWGDQDSDWSDSWFFDS